MLKLIHTWKYRRWAALLSVPVLGLCLGAAPAAHAKTTDGPGQAIADPWAGDNIDPHILAIMRQQEKLNPAVTILTQAAMADPNSGIASVAFEGAGLSLYWKGALTPAMSSALAAARRIGPVTVKPAAYSQAELMAARDRIEKAETGSDIQTIKMNSDGSGLSIERIPPTATKALAAKAARAAKVAGARAPLQTAADVVAAAGVTVPVRITTASAPITLYSCPSSGCIRTNDESPWNSGDYINWYHNTQGNWWHCTTGFGVRVPSWGSQTYILTAAHCATWHAGGGDDAYDGAYEYMGRAMLTEDWDKDLILIDARGYPWMFDGDANTGRHKVVHSWGYRATGEYLCQSGSTSGTVCGLQTQGGDITNWGCDSDGACYYLHGLTQALQVNGQQAAQGGDSGGPVFSLDGDGVRAKGIVSAGQGNSLLFQDMADVTTSRSGAWVAAFPLTS